MAYTPIKDNFGWRMEGENITDLMHNTVRAHLEERDLDIEAHIETCLFNTQLYADSCEYTLDIGKELWLNPQRWSRLIKEYVPYDGMNRLCDQAVEIIRGDARNGAIGNMLFRDPVRYEKKHRWGGCLMGATFNGDNRKTGKSTITFYSRTTYMGYMGLMDAGIAHAMAKEIVFRCKDEPKSTVHSVKDIAFRWHLGVQQLHCFKTMPYIYSQPDLMYRLEHPPKGRRVSIPATWKFLDKWFASVQRTYQQYGVKMLEHEKYGPLKRIKRRWLEYKGLLKKNLPRSTMIGDLTFDKAE